MLPPPYRTYWTFVYDVSAMRFTFFSLSNSQLRYVDLKDFDFSCKTGVEVMNLDDGEAGNVRSAFVPYTAEQNRQLVRSTFGLYESYGIPTSEDLINEIIDFPESTVCEDDGTGGSGAEGGSGGLGGATSNGGTAAALSGSGGTTAPAASGGTQPQLGTGGSSAAGSIATGGNGTGGTASTVANSSASGGSTASTVANSMTNGADSSGCACKLGGPRKGSGRFVAVLLGIAMATRRRSTSTTSRRAHRSHPSSRKN